MLSLFRCLCPSRLCLGLFLFLFSPSSLWANPQPPPSPATLDGRLYNPVASPYSLLGLHASRVLPHTALWGQISIDYAKDLVIGRRGQEIITRPLGHRGTFEPALAFGLFHWIELHLALPLYAQTSDTFPYPGRDPRYPKLGEGSEYMGEGDQGRVYGGLGDLRFGFKARLLDHADAKGFGLAFGLEMTAPTGGNFRGYGGWTFRPRLIADFRLANGLLFAFNLSYTSPPTPPSTDAASPQQTYFQNKYPSAWAWGLPEFPFEHEIRLEIGAEIPLFFSGLSLVTAFQLSLLPSPDTGGLETGRLPAELRAALRWRHPSGLILTFGGGTGLSSGYAAPDFRFFLDIAFGQAIQRQPPRPLETPVTAEAFALLPPPPRPAPPPRRVEAPAPPSWPRTPEPPPLVASRPLSSEIFDQALSRSPKEILAFGDPSLDPKSANDPCKRPLKPGESRPPSCPDDSEGKIIVTSTKIVLKDKIFFASNSDQLEERSFDILKKLAAVLRTHLQIRLIQIEGHTDSRGDLERNVDLSERRSQRVKAFLVQEGVQSERMITKGFGPTKPLSTNKTPDGRSQNRRVDFLVLQIAATPGQGGSR